ncbi:dihydroneopterin aldolase [Endozoicomonas sp. SM1973]|uniref:7,8-dihydroneopterin aldolase n=1 Tax=Spartinivicinus marinus TaxID=2994442 RepID=A0A853IFT8_9GAMM|nr:dihydroneopterin aldolase [Spartinivicinus marinus]MCX4028018.1 dihydroneopterin aldolase [Spartinivicinus marinus]NYZ68357.1 dihydroneopterin aldolase [Spartinivicinus marinus]
MDKVLIEQLEVSTVIGVYEWEKQQPQPLIIDLAMDIDCTAAMQSDDLTDALDYAKVAELVTQYCNKEQFQLLEKLAGELIRLIFTEFSVAAVKIKIRKPQAIENGIAAVECFRTREQMN